MTTAGDRLVARWCEAANALGADAGDVAWVRALREHGLASFEALGLPHRRIESWRHTSLAPVERIDWAGPVAETPSGIAEPDGLLLAAGEAARVVVADGRCHPSSSDIRPFLSIADARRGGEGESLLREVMGQLADVKTDAFTALGTALLDDGVLIEIPRGEQREQPLHVVLAATAEARLACPRLAVVARAGSRATLVLEHVTAGGGPRLTDLVGEIVVEANARLDLVIVQHESDESILVSNLFARQGRDAHLALHTLTLGGRLVRNGLDVLLAEPGAEVDMQGLFVGQGARHVDNHTLVDHAVPHGTSRELYKGVLGGASHGVFCGRVIVRPDAQKTDSSQSNPNLLLTPQAEIDTQPQLEIYADDVKCSHGATIGRLDEDALFYLQSRGIGLDDARVLLTRGFANEIVEALPHAALRGRAAALVGAALEAAIADGEEAAR